MRRKGRACGKRVVELAKARAHLLRQRTDIVLERNRGDTFAIEREEECLGDRRAPEQRVDRKLHVLAGRREGFA